MSKKTVEVEVEIPEGWEAYAFRTVQNGEWFLNSNGDAFYKSCNVMVHDPRFILRKTKIYRDPVLPADKMRVVEFSNDGKDWVQGELRGWKLDNPEDPKPWIDQYSACWKFCQVEDMDGAQ